MVRSERTPVSRSRSMASVRLITQRSAPRKPLSSSPAPVISEACGPSATVSSSLLRNSRERRRSALGNHTRASTSRSRSSRSSSRQVRSPVIRTRLPAGSLLVLRGSAKKPSTQRLGQHRPRDSQSWVRSTQRARGPWVQGSVEVAGAAVPGNGSPTMQSINSPESRLMTTA